MKIERKANKEVQFHELKDGDLFLFTSSTNKKNEVYIKVGKGHYTSYAINAVNLDTNAIERFSTETTITKINGTLVID